jgi:hypothetical protein
VEKHVLIVRTQENGSLTVDEWPDELWFTPEFLEHADPAIVRREGESIVIKVSNGEAEYVIERYPDGNPYVIAAKKRREVVDGQLPAQTGNSGMGEEVQ